MNYRLLQVITGYEYNLFYYRLLQVITGYYRLLQVMNITCLMYTHFIRGRSRRSRSRSRSRRQKKLLIFSSQTC
jgi:hypothetical protein